MARLVMDALDTSRGPTGATAITWSTGRFAPLVVGVWLCVGAAVGAQTAEDETGRRLATLEATHADARIAVLEATVADLKRTTREDTLWIRGIIGAGVGLTGVGIAKFRQKRPAAHA